MNEASFALRSLLGVSEGRQFQLGDALKQNTPNTGHLALRGIAAAAMLFCALNASALSLGRLAVQSGLGETLKAEIEITSLTPEESSNLKVRVAPPEAYRAAGVDYNSVLQATQVAVQRRPDGRTFLRITSNRAVQEPFVDVILELNWSTGRLVREYTLLFDPPSTRTAAPAPVTVTTEPSIASAPPAAPPVAPAVSSAPSEPAAAPRAPRASSRPASMPVDAPVAAAGVDQYTVKPGDTLSRIAGRTLRPGVSLDQMLVSLYKGNPDAFLNNNMNRLRSGVVLSVPSTDAAKALSNDEAKQIIQAQSADFNAFRQRLAGNVPAAKTETSSRQAKGAVQATVEDKKQAAAPSPDKLTLSKGGASPAAKAASEEAKISKEKEKAAAAARVAELSKNVEDLKKLQKAASAAPAAAPVPAPAPAPAAATVAKAPAAVASAPAVAVPTVPVPVPAPVVVPPAPPVVASAPAPVPAVAAPASAVVAASAPAPVVPASAPPVVTAAPTAPATSEPSFVDGILDGSNPLGLAIGGGLIALLAGFGLYRFSKRAKKDSGETSFLESRLQPDSFFGTSGGQRIDTRDASGASSSMSYSLSQLDAIGDVDPVAEADVYLAYGRDLQAEEILKEAMRGNPDRLAIRTKLLEVYAKRRDTKGFELLATQLFSLTQGTGDDWAKAQEMGQQIDPDNPLYRPGGAPSAAAGADGPTEPLGASTMPQSVLPPVESLNEARGSAAPPSLDLDLELDLAATSGAAVITTQPGALGAGSPVQAPPSLDLDFAPAKQAAPAVAEAVDSAPSPLDFDLGAISLDLDAPAKAGGAAALDAVDTGSDDDGRDPLERKLDLAEEFRQIGDMEGARDLLQEVVAKGTGSLRSKAQSMLNALS
ncbi:MAG: FimV/HubP family polar landmark protein [Burkholderiales bacterium]